MPASQLDNLITEFDRYRNALTGHVLADSLHEGGRVAAEMRAVERRVDDVFSQIVAYRPSDRDELLRKAAFLFSEVADSAEMAAFQRDWLDSVLDDMRDTN